MDVIENLVDGIVKDEEIEVDMMINQVDGVIMVEIDMMENQVEETKEVETEVDMMVNQVDGIMVVIKIKEVIIKEMDMMVNQVVAKVMEKVTEKVVDQRSNRICFWLIMTWMFTHYQ